MLAVEIAQHQSIDLDAVRRWAIAEGAAEAFEDFVGELKRRADVQD
jgi:hypothetical protein